MTTKKASTQLPDDFSLTIDRRSWAKVNTPGVNAESEFAEFCDYARSIAWKKVDWEATWRNWLRKAYKRLPAWKLKDQRHQAEPAPAPSRPAQEAPPMSNIAAFCNRVMLGAIRRARGVPEDALERMIAAKNRVVQAWEPYPDDITGKDLGTVLLKELRKAYRPDERTAAP